MSFSESGPGTAGSPVPAMAPTWSPRGGLSVPEALLGRPNTFWLDAHSVVDCDAQLLLATEVTLCCLDRDVSKQELDLDPVRRQRGDKAWRNCDANAACGISVAMPNAGSCRMA